MPQADDPAPFRVLMPQMGESLAEGTVVRWLKVLGDPVARDEPLFEISTDKVDTDVPSPVAGILREILVPEGQTVQVGTAVALVEPSEPQAAGITAEGSTTGPSDEPGGHFKATHPPQLVSFRSRAHDSAPATGQGSAVSERVEAPPAERPYSPAVLDAARRGGVPLEALTTLPGSGRGGRLTKRDVAAFLSGRGGRVEGPAGGHPPAQSPPPEYFYRLAPGDRRVPMSVVRRRIADHMTWSVRISPQATAFAECDVSAATTLIERAREQGGAVEAPLTYTVLAARAAVAVLTEFPRLNASVVDDDLVLKPHVHLGIAVVLPDTDDLIVPVVRNADELSAVGLARAIQDLASRARGRALRPEEVQGGTFTLTNPGALGGLGGTPILNQPQVAILGLGAVTKRAVVVDDAIAIRPVMPLSLTFDHRAADGVVAFRYLDAVRRHLETLDPNLDALLEG